MKGHLKQKIILFAVGLSVPFLTSSCRPVKETTVISKYRKNRTTREFCRITWTKSIVRDTVANYIVLIDTEKKRNVGSHSYALKSKSIYYDDMGRRLKKYISRQRKNQKRQRLRTVYYLRNHYGNTLYDLEVLDKTLNNDAGDK
jgi:hypothetical protein